MKRIGLWFGRFLIVVISFLATNDSLDWWLGPNDPNMIRALHAMTIKAELEKYRSANGKYPLPFPDNPLADISKELGVFVPKDPVWVSSERQYRYVSADGTRYGLLFHLQSGDRCLIGVGAAGTGWWQNALLCSF